MDQIKGRIETVRERIRSAALRCGRNPDSVRLVAVSKTVPVETIREALEGGATVFGENYIQEAMEKISALSVYPLSWHFIGRLQRNKAKYAVGLFDLIHSVDSLRLAEEIDRQARKAGRIQKILLQVNIGRDPAKSGIPAEEALPLVQKIAGFQNLSVLGLMTMPPFFDDPQQVRPYFAALAELRDRIRSCKIPGVCMEELSMGMTGDFEAAVECGATMVRIGTAIFGKRI